ncbi:MAG: ABC transporter ATP-binding protein [Halobacteriota archaeon]
MLMIEAQDVCKVYLINDIKLVALKDINLTIERGEMVSIMGPSGCGKTTLLNCLSGLDELTSGTVKIEGISLESMSDNDRTEYRARRMGFIFQSFNLLPVLTALENIELPLLVSRSDQKEARVRALELLNIVGLEEWGNHKPSELSGGQQQRVTIARALVNNPAIVWADEPTGNLDSDSAQQVMELLIELNKKARQTIVTVTHDSTVGNTADRLITMRDGAIISQNNLLQESNSSTIEGTN